MSAIILGSAGATEQPVKYGWSQDRGPYVIRTWKGPIAPVQIICSQAYFFKLQYDVEQLLGGLAQITITYASFAAGGQGANGPEVVDNWELLPNKVQKDIFESNCALVLSQTTDQLSVIKSLLDTPRGTPTSLTLDAPWDANSDALYSLVRAGVTHWEIFQPVLKRTWRIPQAQSLAASYTNAGKLLSTATLISSEGVPADFVLPLNTVMSQFTNPVRTDGVAVAYAWKKSIPTASIAAYVTREVHLEWEFGLWPTALYGSVI